MELRHDYRNLGGILSNMIDPLIVMKTDGTIQMVNQATLDLLGYAKEELVNQSVHILFLSKEQSSTAAEQETLIMKGPVRNLELEFRKKSGEKVPALFSSGGSSRFQTGRYAFRSAVLSSSVSNVSTTWIKYAW